MSLDDFDRYPLLFGPSPVHRLDRLTDYLGGARIWAKREDCNSGLAFGGCPISRNRARSPGTLSVATVRLSEDCRRVRLTRAVGDLPSKNG